MSYRTTVTLETNDPNATLPGTMSWPLAEMAATYAREAGLAFDRVDATVEREVVRDRAGVPMLSGGSTTIRLRLGGTPWVAVVRLDERERDPASPLDLDRDGVWVGVEAILSGRPPSGARVVTDTSSTPGARFRTWSYGVVYSTAPLADDPTPQTPSEIMASGQTYDRRVPRVGPHDDIMDVGQRPPETFWNGEPCAARRVRVVVGAALRPTFWHAGLEGTERDAVEVTYGGSTFYLDDGPWRADDGQQIVSAGWLKVTVGQGSPDWGHRSLPDDSRVVAVR